MASNIPTPPLTPIGPPNPSAIPAVDPNAPLTTEKLTLEIDKLRKEILKFDAETIKANLEAKELRKRWYAKPSILQPIAAIVVAVAGGLLGYFNGWFDVKLTKIQNEEKVAETKLNELRDVSSNLNQQIAALTIERNNLHDKLGVTISQTEQLQRSYAVVADKAKQGEQYHLAMERARKQLEKTIDEAKAARATAEAATWHVGDVITITGKDSKANKVIPKFAVETPRRYMKIGAATVNDKDIIVVDSDWVAKAKNYSNVWTARSNPFKKGEINFIFSVNSANEAGVYGYHVDRTDMDAGQMELRLSASGYEETSIAIPFGIKAFTAFMNPNPAATTEKR